MRATAPGTLAPAPNVTVHLPLQDERLSLQSRHRWERWEFSGPSSLDIGGTVFRIPMGSQLKLRGPLVWVLLKSGLVHVLSAAGDLDLDAEDRLYFAEDKIWARV